MKSNPAGAIRVGDLGRSVEFYAGRLGFKIVTDQPAPDLAILDGYGYLLLFAGPSAGDLDAFLVEPRRVIRPGAVLHFSGNATGASPDELTANLSRAGLAPFHRVTDYGSITVSVTDPDGYTASFWFGPNLSRERVREIYARGPDALEAALNGLAEEHLDLARAPGKWTIRQIVHHLVDSDTTVLARAKFAIAEPGRKLQPNPYDPDHWADHLDYAGREVGPAVRLFRAIREHMLQLVDHLPGAWECRWSGAQGAGPSVQASLEMLAIHALDHLEQVLETRRVHGL